MDINSVVSNIDNTIRLVNIDSEYSSLLLSTDDPYIFKNINIKLHLNTKTLNMVCIYRSEQ